MENVCNGVRYFRVIVDCEEIELGYGNWCEV